MLITVLAKLDFIVSSHTAGNDNRQDQQTFPSLRHHKRLIEKHSGRLPRDSHAQTAPVRLLRADTMHRDRRVERKATGCLAKKIQHRRRACVNHRTHASHLRLRDRECCSETGRWGLGEVGDGGVDGVRLDSVHRRGHDESRWRGRDGGEGLDYKHGVLQGEGLSGDVEAGEAGCGRKGEREEVGVGGAPDAGTSVLGEVGGCGGGYCGGFAGTVDENDAAWRVQ